MDRAGRTSAETHAMTHAWLAAMVLGGTAVPDPETVRRTAERVVQRPEFQIGQSARNRVDLIDLIISFLKWVLTPVIRLFAALWDISPFLAWVTMIVLVI